MLTAARPVPWGAAAVPVLQRGGGAGAAACGLRAGAAGGGSGWECAQATAAAAVWARGNAPGLRYSEQADSVVRGFPAILPSILALTAAAAVACAHSQQSRRPQRPPRNRRPRPLPSSPAAAPEPQRPPKAPDVQPVSILLRVRHAVLSPDARSALQSFLRQRAEPFPTPAFASRETATSAARASTTCARPAPADAARIYLVQLGLDGSRVSTVSYGNERPRAMGHERVVAREPAR